MTTPSKLLDFFTLEATEYLARIENSLRGENPDVAALQSGSRGLRGSATMARTTPIANLAGRVETIAGKIQNGDLQLDSELRRVLSAAAETLATLIRSVRSWSPEQDERARRALDDLDSYAPARDTAPQDLIVPISELFYSDAGPHIVEVAASARTTFEQRLRERQTQAPAAPTPTASAPVKPSAASPSASPAKPSAGLRGSALREALGSSLAQMRPLERAGEPAQSVVPIQSLLYRGEAAVGRSKELRSQILNAKTPPSRDQIAELCDLVELAAAE